MAFLIPILQQHVGLVLTSPENQTNYNIVTTLYVNNQQGTMNIKKRTKTKLRNQYNDKDFKIVKFVGDLYKLVYNTIGNIIIVYKTYNQK